MNKIEDSNYWLERMIQARITGQDHQAIFHTDLKNWEHIQRTHSRILIELLKPGETVIDVGCGCGYLLDCLPANVVYMGVDLNPHLIEWARRKYEKRKGATFAVANARNLPFLNGAFDWSVSRSVVGCCGVYAGYDAAEDIHAQTMRVGKRSLFLGYEPADQFTFGEDPTHPLTLGTLVK